MAITARLELPSCTSISLTLDGSLAFVGTTALRQLIDLTFWINEKLPSGPTQSPIKPGGIGSSQERLRSTSLAKSIFNFAFIGSIIPVKSNKVADLETACLLVRIGGKISLSISSPVITGCGLGVFLPL